MKFKENDIVRIMKNCEKEITIGMIGVVIMVYEEPDEAYEVEIVDVDGKTKVQSVFFPDELEFISV